MMDKYGEFEKNDVVLLEETGDEFSGKPARVLDQEYNAVVPVMVVNPQTGGLVSKFYDKDNVKLIELETTTLPIEICCSVCNKINWDNKTGGYGEKHLNKDTGLEVLCDDLGKLYIDGDLVPPRF